MTGGPLPVGTLRFFGPGPRLAVIVKVTFAPGAVDAPLVLAPDPIPLSRAQGASWDGALPGELGAASDFVPRKAGLDVLLSGHAHAGAPATRIPSSFRVAGIFRAFSVLSPVPSTRSRLGAAFLRDVEGVGPVDPVGPIVGEGHRAAPPTQRAERLPEDVVIKLHNLSPGGGRCTLALPRVACHAVVEARSGSSPVGLSCDTLWLDTDGPRVALVFRGDVPEPPLGAVGLRRIVVWLDQAGASRSLADVQRELARGTFTFATEAQDLEGGAEPPEPALLLMARYQAMATTPEPTLTLAAYAAVAAAVTEGRESRSAVLARHQLDEETFMLEERAWLEKMAAGVDRGDATTAHRFGELFLAEQERLADPVEATRTLDDFLELELALERSDEPQRVLSERGVRPAEWMRLDRRFSSAAAADPALAAELARRRAALRAGPPEEAS